MVVVRFTAETRDFSLFHSIQTVSEALPGAYKMGTGGSFFGGKAAGA
jgi:hypothetical protein